MERQNILAYTKTARPSFDVVVVTLVLWSAL